MLGYQTVWHSPGACALPLLANGLTQRGKDAKKTWDGFRSGGGGRLRGHHPHAPAAHLPIAGDGEKEFVGLRA